jgi:hypothetical protein
MPTRPRGGVVASPYALGAERQQLTTYRTATCGSHTKREVTVGTLVVSVIFPLRPVVVSPVPTVLVRSHV